MHVEAVGTAKFKVERSGRIVQVHAADLEWDCHGSGERQMGTEVVHTAEADIDGFNVQWELWEYPVGVQNHSDTQVPKGLELIENISFRLVHAPE